MAPRRRLQQPKKPARKPLTPQQLARLIRLKENTYSVYLDFKFGYRNKEDVSTLPPNVLVVGSQNVLTNAADRVAARQGYVLDGPAGNQNTYGIDSSYDFLSNTGPIENLRKWGANLEVRYVNPVTKAVSWINVLSSLNPSNVINATSFFDATTELSNFCLFVNGDTNIYEWSGGMGSFASASNLTGIIATLQSSTPVASGGVDYVIGDVLTLAGGGATATVTSVVQGGVKTITLANGGSGYSANDVLTLAAAGGTLQATVKVLTVDGSGSILTMSIVTSGNGYSSNRAYNATGGGGTLAQFNVTAVGNAVSGLLLTANGSGYSAGTVATTGGSGTGCTVVIASVGNNSITLSGTLTTNQLGFYNASANAGKFSLLINGKTYGYAAANANFGTTFVGISSDPTLDNIAVGDAVIQPSVIGKTAGSSFIGNQFKFDLIANLANQIWYGSKSNNQVYVSKTNNYQDVTSSTVRLAGEGATLVLDSCPVGFAQLSNQMYISAGRDQWWVSNTSKQNLVVSTTVTATELLYVTRLKTAHNQGAQSQGVIGRFKNALVYVSNEQIINVFGPVKNVLAEPQITNLSDSIKYDVDAYDFTNAQVLYDNYFIYVLIPNKGIVRMFNVQKKYWEAPQVLPLSRLYHITQVTGSALFAHSSLTNESYNLFVGYNDNGNPINCIAAFAYDNMSNAKHAGFRPLKKNYNQYYTEGYISSNTQLTVTWNYDFGGFTSQTSDTILGTDKKILFNAIGDGSLGKQSLGQFPIGSIFNTPNNIQKFRKLSTMIRQNYYEYQVVFSSNDVDQQWEILAMGPGQQISTDLPTEITE